MEHSERIHIPIGTGDHLLELLMNRQKEKPRVTIECEPSNRYLTVTMTDGRKHLAKYVHVENFEVFGMILKEMDREIEAMEKWTARSRRWNDGTA